MTSAVLTRSATRGAGSNVWLFVPSGTMPSTSARPPATAAAMLVIGATEVATSSRPFAVPSAVPHPVMTAAAMLMIASPAADRAARAVIIFGKVLPSTCYCKDLAITRQVVAGDRQKDPSGVP
jgi:hypothetical protein